MLSRILGPDGRPVAKTDLTREIATVSLTGVRRRLADTIAQGLTPAKLTAILRSAVEGDANAYLTLAEEMEERSAQYGAVLGVRKRAVLGLQRLVESARDDPQDIELRDAVETHLVKTPAFGRLLAALLDALGKGYSVAEIRWDTEQIPWAPRDKSRLERAYTWRDPRYFVYDQASGRELRLMDESALIDGLPLAPWRFIVHEPSLKMGLPIRGGLARLAATSYMCSTFTLEDWLAFAEVFGMPLRLGRYPDHLATDTSAEAKAAINTLIAAVSGLGSDAAAVLPESMRIDFQAAGSGAGGADLFDRLADRLDKLISKAVLGRSDAADSTSGKLGGEQFASDVRRDILESDAEELSNTLNEQLVRPFVDLNFGPQARYPAIKLLVPDQEDLKGLADMLQKLVPLGLEVEQSVIRDKWGLPDPDPKGKLLGKPASPEPPTPPVAPPVAPPEPPALNRALNRDRLPANADVIDALIADELADWEPIMEPLVDPVQQLASESTTYEQFLAGLPTLLGTLDAQKLIESLAAAAFKARGLGDGEMRDPIAQNRSDSQPVHVTIAQPGPSQAEQQLQDWLIRQIAQ
ncbi:MAG: DUF935 domain-containing protein [Candidatus Competibacter denitrificans]